MKGNKGMDDCNGNTNQNILILGAAGFIGTNLVKWLLQNEESNLLLFDKAEGSIHQKWREEYKRLRFVTGEFSSTYDFEKLTEGIDVVYHLISTTCPTNSNQDVAQEMEANVIPTIKLLDACVKNHCKKIVFLSSGGTVYGKDHNGLCEEGEESFPISSYGIQKVAIEKILYLYGYLYGLDYRIIRLSNPYGPYQRPNGVQGVIATFTYLALNGKTITVYGDGSVIRDYIYIDDAIRGIQQVVNSKGLQKLFNLGSGKGHSINEVIQVIQNQVGQKLEIQHTESRKVDVPVNILNMERFEKEFGVFTTGSLTEGIQKTIQFMQQEQLK